MTSRDETMSANVEDFRHYGLNLHFVLSFQHVSLAHQYLLYNEERTRRFKFYVPPCFFSSFKYKAITKRIKLRFCSGTYQRCHIECSASRGQTHLPGYKIVNHRILGLSERIVGPDGGNALFYITTLLP